MAARTATVGLPAKANQGCWPAGCVCLRLCGQERIGGTVGSSGCVCWWGVPSHSCVMSFRGGPTEIICGIILQEAI